MEILILIIGVVALGAVILFVRRQTKARGRWGLGPLGGVHCPHCGARLPMIRKPSSAEEIMWGGWTCPKCGTKVDKYGNERTAG